MASKDETLKGKAKPAEKTGAASAPPTQPAVAEALLASALANPTPGAPDPAPNLVLGSGTLPGSIPYKAPDPVARPQMAHNTLGHLRTFADVIQEGEPTVTMMFEREVRLKLEKEDGGITVQALPGLHEVPERLSTHWYLAANKVKAYRR